MNVLLQILILLSVIAGLTACDPRHSRTKSTEFIDEGDFKPADDSDEDLLLVGERSYEELQTTEPPRVVTERDRGPTPARPEPPRPRITNPKLVINVDLQEMDFKFTVESARFGREAVHLKGRFERGSPDWISTLYAVDRKVLEERRVSADVWCLTANYCDVIAVNIYYDIGEPETKPIQLLSGVEGPRIAMSGDQSAPEPEVPPAPLPKPPQPPRRPDDG